MSQLEFDFSNTLEENVGAENGLSLEELKKWEPKLSSIRELLQAKRKDSNITYINLPEHKVDLSDLKETGKQIANQYEAVVLIGIGGSALGPFALFKALKHPYHNQLSSNKRDVPKFFVMDNVDPDSICMLADIIDLKKTAFIVITKSGSTAETIANFIYFLTLAEHNKIDIKKQLYFVTDPEKGKLRQLANEWGIKTFSIPQMVGGRFSVLTPVGLLPAASLLIDIDSLIEGARDFAEFSFSSNILQSPSFLYALVHYLYMQKQKNIHVMFPYANSLYPLADWFRQLWAESLGKKYNRNHEEIFVGPTPVKALGTTDQHSQVQLYIEGPNDKVFTFLEVQKFNQEGILNADIPLDDFNYLQGKSLQNLILAEKKATELALTENGRPNLSIVFPEVNAYNIGAFFFAMELSTDIMGELLHINAFDQPGVEHGKIATYALMGRDGFQDKKKEIEFKLQQKREYKIRF